MNFRGPIPPSRPNPFYLTQNTVQRGFMNSGVRNTVQRGFLNSGVENTVRNFSNAQNINPNAMRFLGQASNFPGNPVNQAGGRGIGGLISKLFSGGNTAQSIANPANLQNLANPSNISGMLTNVQKALRVAEQVTPMVQQYGPMVKNLPAMVKLYNEIRNSDDSDGEVNESKEVKTNTTTEVETEERVLEKKEKEQVVGTSKPKLYINS